ATHPVPNPPSFTRFTLFFFTPTSTPATYTLSLHDALPISAARRPPRPRPTEPRCFKPPSAAAATAARRSPTAPCRTWARPRRQRSEEHTSELQSRENLVCRLLLEKKKQVTKYSKQQECSAR